jgi:hypothetical protein
MRSDYEARVLAIWCVEVVANDVLLGELSESAIKVPETAVVLFLAPFSLETFGQKSAALCEDESHTSLRFSFGSHYVNPAEQFFSQTATTMMLPRMLTVFAERNRPENE